jgi:ABC-2 type transport system ATP-binding protein
MESYRIQLDRVTRVYGRGSEQTPGVDEVSLHIQPGEILCLLGPNGAGKTTLLGLLSLLAAPTRGAVYFNDVDARHLRGRARVAVQRRIALVPETPFVYALLTGREFLHFLGDLYGTARPVLEERLRGLLAAFELEAAADRLLRTYSQGMLKKIVIAAALANDPAVLLLDEPTNGLDPAAAAALETLLAHERGQGKTIVLSTHNLDVAERLSDRAAILDRGRLVSVERVEATAPRGRRSRLEQLFFEVTNARPEPCIPS